MIRIALTVTALSLGVSSAAPAPAPRAEPVAATPVSAAGHVHDHAMHSHRPARAVDTDVAHWEPEDAAAAEPEVVAVRPATARPVAERGAMFLTVEAAMRYLASAYNHRDLVSLKHVTTPDARKELDAMRSYATGLRLASCTWGEGYSCEFTHAYPDKPGTGKAWLQIAPARRPGWYMTVMEGCG